jgi:hypothetical protein
MGAATLRWNTPFAVPLTVLLLSFMMGLQNAVGSKTSGGSMRTTHMTGNITDLGMELGKLLLWQRRASAPQPVPHHWPRMKASAGCWRCLCWAAWPGHWVFSTWALSAWCRWPLLLALAVPPLLRDLPRSAAARPALAAARPRRRWRLSNKPDRAQDVQ